MCSNTSLPFIDLDIETAGALSRPWKQFWPPTETNRVWTWLEANDPGVLRWRFDPEYPFDRPWRQWTRVAAQKESPHHQGLPSNLQSLKIQDGDVPEQETKACSQWVMIRHLIPDRREKPYLSRLPFIEGAPRTNMRDKSYDVRVENISGNEKSFSLASHGFEYATMAITYSDWNDAVVTKQYIPALKQWLCNYFRSADVLIYAFNYRSMTDGHRQDSLWKKPFFKAHCDATSASSCTRSGTRPENHVLDIYCIWRPLTGPYQNSPLALCDYRSLQNGDLIPADIVFPHYCDEGYELLHRTTHKWYYKNPMGSNEVILFTLDDTHPDRAKCCPHSAFNDTTVPDDTPTRISIEVRAIVFEDI